MSELKRCPFCGDEVEIFPTGLYYWKHAIRHKSKTECILDANAFAIPYEEEDAVRIWNTRADRKGESDSEKPNNCEPHEEELVRCGRCKHCQTDLIVARYDNGTEVFRNICYKHDWYVDKEDYCSQGEEREKAK